MTRRRHAQRGASYVMVMGVIVVLAMFIAVAVNIGRLTLLRDDAQDAADAAALAYAEEIIQNGGGYPSPTALAHARAAADANLGAGTTTTCAPRRSTTSLLVDCRVSRRMSVPRYLRASGSMTLTASATASLPPIDVRCTDRVKVEWFGYKKGDGPALMVPDPPRPLGADFMPFVEIQGWEPGNRPHTDGGWDVRLPPNAPRPFMLDPVVGGSDWIWVRFCSIGSWTQPRAFAWKQGLFEADTPEGNVYASTPPQPADGQLVALPFFNGYNTGCCKKIFGVNVHGDDDMGFRSTWLDEARSDASGMHVELFSANNARTPTSGPNAMAVKATMARVWLPPTYKVTPVRFTVFRKQIQKVISFERDEAYDRQAFLISLTTYDPDGHKTLPFLARCYDGSSKCTIEMDAGSSTPPCTDEETMDVCLDALGMLCDENPGPWCDDIFIDGDLSPAWQDEDKLWDNITNLMCDMFRWPRGPIGFCADFGGVTTWDEMVFQMCRVEPGVCTFLDANKPPEAGEGAHVSGRVTQIQWSSRPWLVR